MPVPYETTGRTLQKRRTRTALLNAAHSLLATGATPTVEQTADAAGISRTTAYRYFPNQRALLMAAIPEIDRTTLLDTDPDGGDTHDRLDRVIAQQTAILRDWEPQLRAALLLSLQQGPGPSTERPVLRQGRAIGWIAEALSPLAQTHPGLDRHRLAIAIRATCGIEAWVWLTDVAGATRAESAAIMHDSARALLDAALARAASAADLPQRPADDV